MSYILYNVDNRTVHTNSQERPTYYGYDFVFIAGIGVGLLIYKTFFLPASLQQHQQQQLQLQQQEEKKKQQEEEDQRQQQPQQPQQPQQQQEEQHKQQHREDSMIKYLKGALVLGIFALGVFVGREPTKQSQPGANTISEKVSPKKVDDSTTTNQGTDSKANSALEQASNANNLAGNVTSKEPVTNPVNNTNENGQPDEKYFDANTNNQEVGRNAS